MSSQTEAIENLVALGLSTPEAKTYIALIQFGPNSATSLAKLADLPQPKVYGYLQSLETKGIIKLSEIQGRSKVYIGKPYEAVLGDLFTIQNAKVSSLKKYFESLDIKEKTNKIDYFLIYEGFSKIENALEDIFRNAKKNILILNVGIFCKKIEELKQIYPKLQYDYELLGLGIINEIRGFFKNIDELMNLPKFQPLLLMIDIDVEKQNIGETIIASSLLPENDITIPVLIRMNHPSIMKFQFQLFKIIRIIFGNMSNFLHKPANT